MQDIIKTETRLRDATSLADVLAASFDAFEVIRLSARAAEDRVPELFAAFMTTADAAVDGRDALMSAPSLPSGGGAAEQPVPAALDGAVDEITDALAILGTLLNERLTHAASRATRTADQSACKEAAKAAERIHHLMARDDHDGHLR